MDLQVSGKIFNLTENGVVIQLADVFGSIPTQDKALCCFGPIFGDG